MKRTLVILIVIVAFTAPASASPIDDFVGEDDLSLGERISSYINAVIDRVTGAVTDSSDWSASEVATDVQTFYNDRPDEFESYANNRTNASTDYDVIEIHIVGPESAEKIYLVSEVVDGNYTNSSVVDTTDRTVDEWVSMKGSAAKNLHSELKRFYDDYVTEDKSVTKTYVHGQTIRYLGDVRSSALGNSSRFDG